MPSIRKLRITNIPWDTSQAKIENLRAFVAEHFPQAQMAERSHKPEVKLTPVDLDLLGKKLKVKGNKTPLY